MDCTQDVKTKIIDIVCLDPTVCFNATVIHFSSDFTQRKGRKKTICYTQLAAHLLNSFPHPYFVSSSKLVSKIIAVIGQYRSLLMHIRRDSIIIEQFLFETFEFPVQDPSSPIPQPLTSVPSSSTVDNTSSSSSPAPQPPSLVTSPVTSPVKTRDSCGGCSSSKKVNIKLKKDLTKQRSKVRQSQCFLADVKRKLGFKTNKQKLTRKERKVGEQKVLIKQLEIKNKNLHRRALHLVNQHDSDLVSISALQRKISLLENNITDLRHKLYDLEKYSDDLKLKLDEVGEVDKNKDHFITKKGKAYSPLIRKLIYSQLVCDVPVRHCGPLLNEFSEVLLSKPLDTIPSPSSCAQMAYELGVLTTIQAMELILSAPGNICLSWDATTVDGHHINEIHLTLDRSKCLVLDVRHLPGGKTSDYVSHITSTLSEAADIYARYTGSSSSSVHRNVISRITSTLTDRAAVNACVTRQLCDELEANLMLLNCNIHPLDSIARYAKQALVQLDKTHAIHGSCYGSDGAAANLINAVSVLRFKDGSGDPAGFKNMLRSYDLPMGTFVRYVGNRIHVLFHLAGVLLLHWQKVDDFLKTQSNAGGLLRSKLIKDMADEKIMVQVWALAVVGKIFSGPWMTKFYSSQMSNLDMRPLVQSTEKQLESWIAVPQLLLRPTENVFGESLPPDDNVLTYLQDFITGEVEIQLEAVQSILRAALTVLQRQLKNFLEEDSLTDAEKLAVSSAPTNNMASERTLGCYDKMFRQAPVATGGFLDGKVRSKMNKCTQWLSTKPTKEFDNLVDFALREAVRVRKIFKILNKELNDEICNRRKIVASDKLTKDRNKVLKKIKHAIKTKSVIDIDCPPSVKDHLHNFNEQPDSITGLMFIHSIGNDEFYGRVMSADNITMVVGYWGLESSELSSVDHTISCIDFFADAALGAVTFF